MVAHTVLLLCLAALAAAQPALEPNSVIVSLARDTFSVQSADGAAAADAAGDLGQPIGPHLRRVPLQPGESVQDAVARLAAMPGVEAAYPDHPVWAESIKPLTPAPAGGVFPGLPDNRGLKLQWGALRIGMPDAWQLAKGGASRDKAVTVCVVDSGVDYKHPDLVGNLGEGVGYNAVDGEDKEDPRDRVGHGTQVAGVIAGTGAGGGAVGINRKNINLLSCKFMSADGFGRTSDAVQCLDWCLGRGARIISASWTSGQLDNPPLEEAVARTEAAGALLVVSAGNQGADMRRHKFYPQAYAKTYKNMLVVAATDEYDDHVPFSNFDPRTVHLSAPGNWIYTTIMGGGYTFASGTSIAAPFASGAAALAQAAAQDRLGKTLTAMELKELLMSSSEVLPQLKGRTESGGRLRVDWALQSLLGEPRSPPTRCLERPGSKGRKCRDAEQRRRAMLEAAPEGGEHAPLAGADVEPVAQPAEQQQQQQQQQARPWEAAHLGRPGRRLMAR